MIVKEIASCPIGELRTAFNEVVHTVEFSAAATCGFETLSQERKETLVQNLERAGLRLTPNEADYVVRTIASRIINRT